MTIAPKAASLWAREICAIAPILPVLMVDDVTTARPLAEALIAGGLTSLEVTSRTPAALEVIRVMSGVPAGHLGAGTLITHEDFQAAKEAGANFGVSPGATDELLAACEAEGLPLLPGAATAFEAMRLLVRGYDMLKFFPAESSGGVSAQKAIGGLLPRISFCPTGGVSAANAGSYLAQKNVVCVGGSCVAPNDLIAVGDWVGIETLARDAAQLEVCK